MIGELCVMWSWPMGNKKSVRGAFSQRMSSIVEEYHPAQGKEGGRGDELYFKGTSHIP